MEKKLLSIIIPVYNNQDQIKNLIDEILSMGVTRTVGNTKR